MVISPHEGKYPDPVVELLRRKDRHLAIRNLEGRPQGSPSSEASVSLSTRIAEARHLPFR